jgi:hypothetical protein
MTAINSLTHVSSTHTNVDDSSKHIRNICRFCVQKCLDNRNISWGTPSLKHKNVSIYSIQTLLNHNHSSNIDIPYTSLLAASLICPSTIILYVSSIYLSVRLYVSAPLQLLILLRYIIKVG